MGVGKKASARGHGSMHVLCGIHISHACAFIVSMCLTIMRVVVFDVQLKKHILSQLSLGCIIYYTSTHQIHSFVNFKDKKDEMSILVGVTDC